MTVVHASSLGSSARRASMRTRQAQFCDQRAPPLALAHPFFPGGKVAEPLRQGRYPLLTKLSKGRAQRGAGDLDHPFERAIELEDKKDRTGHRQCTDEEGHGDDPVARGEEPKAHEDDGQPEDEHHEEGTGDRAV